MDPNQAPILTLKGEILLEQKNFDAAEAAFKKAAKIAGEILSRVGVLACPGS